jgi:hypothetical protein
VLIVLVLMIPAAAGAGAELVLEDGQVLKGTELERKDDFYILHLATGGVLTLPAALIKEFRLTAEGEPEEKKTTPTGLRETEPEELSGAGAAPPLPRRGEQIEAFDKPPARFRNSIIDPVWRPESDWTDDPELNNFSPTRWYNSSIDSTWRPQSAFVIGADVFSTSRSTWQRSIVDSTWTPSDGFDSADISLVAREEYVPLVTFEP